MKQITKVKKDMMLNYGKGKRDVFELSFGNFRVLELIPTLMSIPKYRKQLREIAIEYEFNK